MVNPTSTSSDRPSYDGLYPILRDAVDGDESFGETYHLAIYDGELGISRRFFGGRFDIIDFIPSFEPVGWRSTER